MNKVSIVLGLGFGDEGKGQTTHLLCSQANNPLVIRFNGGHQAGHTVTQGSIRHVFSNFGSGTLLNFPTFWSEYCTISPYGIVNEYNALRQLGVSPKLFIDNHCAVVTHYDVLYNRLLEQYRDIHRHGSCGLGFGATIEREECGVHLIAENLLDVDIVKDKLHQIQSFYRKKFSDASLYFDEFNHDDEDSRFIKKIEELQRIIMNEAVTIIDSKDFFKKYSGDRDIIFEGAQGVLLDMEHGDFPNVTRSYTTSKNALELISNYLPSYLPHIQLYFVSRCYLTRHGAGYHPTEHFPMELTNFHLETNIFNKYQESFRIGPLDFSLIKKAIAIEKQYSGFILENSLVMTCFDQLITDRIPIIIDYNIQHILPANFYQLFPSNNIHILFNLQ